MKVFLALLTAAGCFGGSFLLIKINGLTDEIAGLEGELKTKASRESVDSATRDIATRENDENARARSKLDSRLAQLESTFRDASRKDDAKPALAFASLRDEVTEHSEAIDDLRDQLEKSSRTSNALDQTASRLLSAVGGSRGENGESGSGGLADLLEMGSLMRKKPEDLTEEERVRRDEMTAKMRDRMVDMTLSGFDRSLDVKLDDNQRESLGAFLAEENRELSGLREQGLDREARAAKQKEVRARTDQQVGGLLSAEQQKSWTKYRSRSSRSRGWDRFR
jgi:dsDNA-binding SOS-regulon protein